VFFKKIGAVLFCTQQKILWKNFTLCFFRCFFKKIKKDKNVEKNNFLCIFFLKIVVFTKKKYQMSFIFIQKSNEKATKTKKNQIPFVYIYIFSLFLLTYFFFLKITPKITQIIISAPIFFRNTAQYSFKTPIFILHSVLCSV
jgi:hypothetical protein